MPKSQKVQNWNNFWCQFWKVWNSFLKNIPEKNILHFIILFPFLTFFLLYEHPKGTKHGMKHENPLFFKKRFLCKRCWICCKNSTNVAKNSPIILWYPVYFQIFFLGVISTCSKEKPQKSWENNEKFWKDSIFMGKHGWHPLNTITYFATKSAQKVLFGKI